MPRRSILSVTEQASLLALPETEDDLIRHYTFSESDLSIIRQHRGSVNRLGFAVQLCYLRFPGTILSIDQSPFPPLLRLISNQIKVPVESWADYSKREQTRREHLAELQAWLRDATHVLDGLLYHESDLRIEEHYTDTAGFTDHVFALMHLLGFRFAPRIRDLADKRLYIHGDAKQYPTLAGMIGGSVNVKHIRAHWDEILRLAASIKQGTVTASLMLRKLGTCRRWGGSISI